LLSVVVGMGGREGEREHGGVSAECGCGGGEGERERAGWSEC